MPTAGTCSWSETLKQAGKHSLYLEKLGFDFMVPIDLKHPKVAGQQKKILEFASRSHGDIKELPKFCGPPTAATLRDVCGNGAGRSPDLAAKTKALVGRKFAGKFVCTKGHSVAAAPNLQLAEVLHDLTPLASLQVLRNYLQLNTNNCQLQGGGGHAD
ncbi:MAG TPA: hypothetical protein VFI38_17375 [Candidatus Acidoferrum sp.]|nr:hypothetical protein [Candidatus Acidoferrum sp.]